MRKNIDFSKGERGKHRGVKFEVVGAVKSNPEPENIDEVLALVSDRFEFPKDFNRLKYFSDVDVLVIGYSRTDSVISDSDDEKGLIYNYDIKDNLTSIEVLDVYGKFIEKEDE